MACDLWQLDLAKLRELQETVAALLEEAHANPIPSCGKSAAVLRGYLSRMTQNVAQLEQYLMKASESPELYGIDRLQLQERHEILKHFLRARDNQLEVFKELFSQSGAAVARRDSLSAANARSIDDYGDSSTTSGLDDFAAADSVCDSFDAAARTAREQDEQLSFLEGSVQNLKNISYAIKDEVAVHHRLLDATEAEVDRADAQVIRNKALIKKLMKRHSTLFLLLIALALLCLLVLLLVFTA